MPCLSIILFDKPDLVWYVLHQTDVKNMHLYIFRPNTSSSSQQRKEREREREREKWVDGYSQEKGGR